MRIAVVSDIHGNLTALEAVIADLKDSSPDLVLHGGDLADNGSSPFEIIDRIRELGWKGVYGNTDEMLFRPESVRDFAKHAPGLHSLLATIEEMAAWTREELGDERLAWLRALPDRQVLDLIALVHASPGYAWRAPNQDAAETELELVFSTLRKRMIVYGHIHYPYVRTIGHMTIANSGSAGLPYDGDFRAAYLLIDENPVDGNTAVVRRVEYDVDKELKALTYSGLPHAEWIAKTLSTARPQLP
jgi:putative phosphoesterase